MKNEIDKAFEITKKDEISNELIKNLIDRLGALRRYLWHWWKKERVKYFWEGDI